MRVGERAATCGICAALCDSNKNSNKILFHFYFYFPLTCANICNLKKWGEKILFLIFNKRKKFVVDDCCRCCCLFTARIRNVEPARGKVNRVREFHY